MFPRHTQNICTLSECAQEIAFVKRKSLEEWNPIPTWQIGVQHPGSHVPLLLSLLLIPCNSFDNFLYCILFTSRNVIIHSSFVVLSHFFEGGKFFKQDLTQFPRKRTWTVEGWDIALSVTVIWESHMVPPHMHHFSFRSFANLKKLQMALQWYGQWNRIL